MFPQPSGLKNNKNTIYVPNNQVDKNTMHKDGEEITFINTIGVKLLDFRPTKFSLGLSLKK